MADSKAKLGHGTTLKRGNGASPEVFTPIAEVIAITPPAQERGEVEVTHMASPEGFREYIAGLKEPGGVSFQVNWIPNDPTHNSTTGVMADWKSGIVRHWQIEFPDTSTSTFSAFVKKVGPEVPIDKQMTASVEMKVSGAVAWVEAA